MPSPTVLPRSRLPQPEQLKDEADSAAARREGARRFFNAKTSSKGARPQPPIWWSNAIFFTSMHLLTLYLLYIYPPHLTHRANLWLCFTSWQLATFGITVGYHRLWSHRAFEATKGLRVVLAGMGCLGFQGSVRWWVLRHRMHHRWTDTEDDPYNAKRGLLFSHLGWIFRKPEYPKLALISRADLDADPIVRFQHRFYLPLTLSLGLFLPTIISFLFWSDPLGGFLYGGLLARLLIWHFTFMINSLAHWAGERLYSEEVSARGNFLLAIATGGEANHNYHHVFPRDFRNGPSWIDWDPSKWIIYLLHYCTPFVPRVHFASPSEIEAAKRAVRAGHRPHSHSFSTLGCDSGYGTEDSSSPAHSSSEDSKDGLFVWERSSLAGRVPRGKLWLMIEGYVVDATAFARSGEHPGGLSVLREYRIRRPDERKERESGAAGEVRDATEAFNGGLNDHLGPARRAMRAMRVARVFG